MPVSARLGTRLYYPPEFLKNEPYSYPLDVWALGIVITEMCTFQHPFIGTAGSLIKDNILCNDPTPIPQLSTSLPVSITFHLS